MSQCLLTDWSRGSHNILHHAANEVKIPRIVPGTLEKVASMLVRGRVETNQDIVFAASLEVFDLGSYSIPRSRRSL